MGASYTAVVQQDGQWWIGWVEEIPGVNSQGQTRGELLENLGDALEKALEMNRSRGAGDRQEVMTTGEKTWRNQRSTRTSTMRTPRAAFA